MESSGGPDTKNRRSTRAKSERPKPAANADKAGRKKQIRGNDRTGRRRSDAIIAFAEKLTIPSGVGQGELFKLDDWQKDFIRNVYDPTTLSGAKLVRKIRRALLSIGRKNGKTTLAAVLVLVHLVGPEAKLNAEVYSAATDRAQASHIYKMVKQIIELDGELREMCQCFDSTKRIVCYQFGSFYQALSADARRQHGFNPSFVVYDELAQAKDRELYDVLSTSFGAQDEALLLVISTQSSDAQSIMTELCDDAIKQANGEDIDDTFYGIVYAVPEELPDKTKVDPFDETHWHLANPGLGQFRSLVDMRSMANKASKSPSFEASFRNLYLNQRVDGVQRLLNSRDWRACETKYDDNYLRRFDCYAALDLSARQDLCAFVQAWDCRDHIAVRSMFWTPDHEIDDRERLDAARYKEWAQAGWLRILSGRAVDYGAVARDVAQLVAGHNIIATAYDQWRIDEFKAALAAEGISDGLLKLNEFPQTFKKFSPAIERLENEVIQHRLHHDGNPVLTYCLSNARVISDTSGNRKFDKRQRNRRIDGAVTLAMAIGTIASAERPEVKGPSVYETRGIVRL